MKKDNTTLKKLLLGTHTKFWNNIGMASLTIIFLYAGFKGALTEWYMWAYTVVVAAPYLADKLISLRWGLYNSYSLNDTTNFNDNKNNYRKRRNKIDDVDTPLTGGERYSEQ